MQQVVQKFPTIQAKMNWHLYLYGVCILSKSSIKLSHMIKDLCQDWNEESLQKQTILSVITAGPGWQTRPALELKGIKCI